MANNNFQIVYELIKKSQIFFLKNTDRDHSLIQSPTKGRAKKNKKRFKKCRKFSFGCFFPSFNDNKKGQPTYKTKCFERSLKGIRRSILLKSNLRDSLEVTSKPSAKES